MREASIQNLSIMKKLLISCVIACGFVVSLSGCASDRPVTTTTTTTEETVVHPAPQ